MQIAILFLFILITPIVWCDEETKKVRVHRIKTFGAAASDETINDWIYERSDAIFEIEIKRNCNAHATKEPVFGFMHDVSYCYTWVLYTEDVAPYIPPPPPQIKKRYKK
jgi:hypothetical protein